MSFWKEPIQSNNQRCDSQNRIVVPNGGYRYVEEEIVRSLDIERVRAALKALTPEERDIIMNFYFSENPLLGEALAEKFATTKSSIYRRRDHALRKLKSILGNA